MHLKLLQKGHLKKAAATGDLVCKNISDKIRKSQELHHKIDKGLLQMKHEKLDLIKKY